MRENKHLHFAVARSRRPPQALRLAIALAVLAAVSGHVRADSPGTASITGISAIVSSDGGNNAPYTGLDIGNFIGANTFYTAGYTGTRAIIGNIEAGVTWNAHEALTQGQVAQYFADPSITSQAGWTAATNTWTDQHATWTGQLMVGHGTHAYQNGIAYGATLYSGAMSTQWDSQSSFEVSDASFVTPYYDAMIAGVNGQGTVDVINSSWGSSGGRDGNSFYSRAMDALIYTSGKTVCFSAGNSGSGTGTIGEPASGFNELVVGATSSDTTNYNAIASFSSRSPTDVYDPALATTVTGARACVDLVAPGANFTLASYQGGTGGNSFGGGTSTSTTAYNSQLAGTSFSSPTVAASVALVVDAGKALFPTNPQAIDARIIKSVLMNSATKLDTWSNGQSSIAGVITTTQSLDYTQGAGQINLTQAYQQYTASTTDLPGFGPGKVLPIGWDYGRLAAGGHADYPITVSLTSESMFTVTLDWFAHSTLDVNALTDGYGAFDNLDLQVWSAPNGVAQTLIAQSISKYNSAEHLYFALPSAGNYLIRVLDAGFNWNGLNGITDTSTDFGLAWSGIAYTCSYVGPSAGAWSTTGRWSASILPAAAEDVIIGSGASVTYDYSGPAIAINSLTIDNGSALNQSGLALGTGNEIVGSTAAGSVTQSGGTHNITYNLFLAANPGSTGTFTLSGTGSFSAAAAYVGGTDTTSGGAGTLNINGGTAAIAGVLQIWNSLSSVNLQGGALSVGSLNVVGGTFSIGSASTLTTTAGISVSGGALASTDPASVIVGNVAYSSNIGSTYAAQIAGSLNYTGAPASSFGKITDNGATPSTLTVNNASASVSLTSPANTYTGATTVSAGTLTVNGTIDTTSAVSVAAGATLNLNGGMMASTLAITNNGTLNTALAASVGAIQGTASAPSLYTGATTVAASSQLTANFIRQASLSIGDSATVTLRESAATLASGWPSGDNNAVSIIGNLSLGSLSTFDSANNDLIINWTGGSDPYQSIEAAVRAGYNGGAWNGSGIVSSDAAARNIFTLLVLDNANLGGAGYSDQTQFTSFDGITVPAETVIVKFTHQDDLNGDGFVTASDTTIFAADYNAFADTNTAITHAQGDMDFDGRMTFNDAQLFNLYYNTSLASLPEPASLAILMLGASALLTRRR